MKPFIASLLFLISLLSGISWVIQHFWNNFFVGAIIKNLQMPFRLSFIMVLGVYLYYLYRKYNYYRNLF